MTMMTEVGTCPTCHGAYRHVRRMIPWGDDMAVPCDNEWHDVEQLELDMQPYVKPEYVVGATIQERFLDFHAKNGWVLTALERLTTDYLERGAKKVGIGMLTEVLRWQYSRSTRGEIFKLNNSYRSRYVRLMVERHPEWDDVFETRELTAA
jgi:hypothetical protein